MNAIEEIAGGHYSDSHAAGTVTAGKYPMYGFILAEDGEVTDITYSEERQENLTADYGQCIAGHFYRFPSPVTEATFSVGVTIYW